MTEVHTSPSIPDLSFTIAITGHQDIAPAAYDELQRKIETLLVSVGEEITNTLGWRQGITLRFLSALAPGADQIGARAVLSLTENAQAPVWALEAILPFNLALCQLQARSALGKRAARGTFDPADIDTQVRDIAVLASKADRLATLDDLMSADAQSASEQEADWISGRYAALGQMLVRRADLLLALWDGNPPRGRGGTADVVSEACLSGVPTVWIDPKGRSPERSILPAVIGDHRAGDGLASQLKVSPGAVSKGRDDAIKAAIARVLPRIEQHFDEDLAD